MKAQYVQAIRSDYASIAHDQTGKSTAHVGEKAIRLVDMGHSKPGRAGTAFVRTGHTLCLSVGEVPKDPIGQTCFCLDMQQVAGVRRLQGSSPVIAGEPQSEQRSSTAYSRAKKALRNVPEPRFVGSEVEEVIVPGDVADPNVDQVAETLC